MAELEREDQQEEPPATEEPQQETPKPDPNTWDGYDWQRVWADPGYFLGGDH